MTTYLERRWGGGGKDPANMELLEALDEMSAPDPEYPDCWLADENQCTIAFNEDGRVVFENPEEDEGPWHMKNCSREQVLTLWHFLQSGKMAEIRAFPWIDGYQ